MRRLGIALFVSLTVCGVSTAWAQYGMYGSPDMLPVQQYPAQPAAAAYQPHQAGAQYAYPAPAAQPVAWTAPVDEQPAMVQPTAGRRPCLRPRTSHPRAAAW